MTDSKKSLKDRISGLRKPKAEVTLNDEELLKANQQGQNRIGELEQELQNMRGVIAFNELFVSQFEDTLVELRDRSNNLTRPVLSALVELELGRLGRVPGLFLDDHYSAKSEFEYFSGKPSSAYLDPTLASSELLTYRLHTVVKLLCNSLAGDNISVQDVAFQEQNDVEILENAERFRKKLTEDKKKR